MKMALIVSEQMQQRKKLKFQRELKRTLSAFSSVGLNDYLTKIFAPSAVKPTADHFMEMTLASKFGAGNAINSGGVGFLLESCIAAFNHGIAHLAPALNPWGGYGCLVDEKAPWSNGYFYIEIDETLFPFVQKIDAADLIFADEISPYLFLDNETRAFGFIIVPQPPMKLEEFKRWGKVEGVNGIDGDLVEKRLSEGGYAQYQLLDFDTGPMEYISVILMRFGAVDKLIQSLPDRDRHKVTSHSRQLSSGKTTTVKAHQRKTPLRLVASSGELTDHVVYSVTDHAGDVRYIGEGKRERPKHVNSGASHNWKINEHYFTKGEMTVEILHDGLTKSEALAIEQMLIKNRPGTGLWNVRDYEPFSVDFERSISLQEIQDF
jgi:hypothetical protein